MPVPLGAVVVAALVEAAWHLASPRDLAVDLAVLAGLIFVAFVSWRFWAPSRREQADLQESEARQRAIIDAAGEAVIVIDDQATITTFNRAAERMFGYTAAEMIGTSLERLMTDGGRQAHAAYLAKYGVTAMVEAARLRTVHKGLRKRGDVFPFELTMSEWRDGDRRMFTGVMRDVTERERTADALRESQARFAALFESSGEPLFVFELAGDGGFVMEWMNRAAEELTGFSRFALKGGRRTNSRRRTTHGRCGGRCCAAWTRLPVSRKRSGCKRLRAPAASGWGSPRCATPRARSGACWPAPVTSLWREAPTRAQRRAPPRLRARGQPAPSGPLCRYLRGSEARYAGREIIEPRDQLGIVCAPAAGEPEIEIAERAGLRDVADMQLGGRGREGGLRVR
jgi:PAS domain S-box-containing protein